MNISIIDVEQGSPEWFAARAGIPTASRFKHILSKGRGGERSRTRDAYLYALADEAIYHDPVETYTNEDLERGKVMEAEARSIYALENDVIPEQVGFIVNHDLKAGCSPDALIGRDGILEIKTSFPRLWIPLVIRDEFNMDHQAQCMGMLLVSGREWVDLMTYWPKRRPFIKRAYRDEAYIKDLAKAVAAFNEELAATIDALKTRFDLTGQLQAAQ